MTQKHRIEISAPDNYTGYRTFRAGPFGFRRDEYFAHIHCPKGRHIMPIYDGAIDEGIKVIDVRHEQAAVHAADAYSRLNPDKVGCAIVTAGPGVTDGVTGIANAWRANSPTPAPGIVELEV